MKKLTVAQKVILTIIAAVLFWFIEDHLNTGPIPALVKTPATVEKMRTLYDADNYEYFGNTLPKNTIIDWNQYRRDMMASTDRLPNGQFIIQLNPYYATSDRWQRYLILHESCHIETWDEARPDNQIFSNESLFHARKWRACMLKLDAVGAFREILIDGYSESLR
jgi:hypothetical protein